MNIVTFRGPRRILSTRSSAISLKTFATKLMEVGHLDAPKTTERYKAGQLFLHRLFGYRGVILLPWYTRVFDRDKSRIDEADDVGINETDSNKAYIMEGDTTNTDNTFYSVFIDTRDHPFVRAHTSAVTIMRNSGEHGKGDLYTIPGLDYVSHQDVMPYTPSPSEQWPFQHQLAEQFLSLRPGLGPAFGPSDTFLNWQQKNRQWLEVREAHRQTTEKIRVTVIPFFLGHHKSLTDVEFWWRYWICLENTGEQAVRLRERHWKIFSETGVLETVRGRGVLGEEPVLSPGLPAFQYTSHVSLQAPSGHMWGTLSMMRENGNAFDCKIPKFCLKRRELDSF